MRELIPNIEVKGCLFHFTQAVYRKIGNIGLKHAYANDPGTRKLCRQLMALPILPKDHIVRAFYKLTEFVVEADETAGLHLLKRLVEYMRTTWIGSAQFPPSSWCWYREAVRTNNDVEGWHLKLIKTAKKGNV